MLVKRCEVGDFSGNSNSNWKRPCEKTLDLERF